MVKIFVVILVVFGLIAAVLYNAMYSHVEPGNIGILVDLGTSQITPVTENKWFIVGRYQKLVQWPGGQQVYVMDKSGATGQIKGDDSIQCRTADTQSVSFDSQTDWRIDPAQIVQTYQLWRDVPLTGALNRDAPGNVLEDLIIRNATRNSIRNICAEFGWADIMGAEILKFQAKVDADVKATTAKQGVIVSEVTIRQRYPSPELETLMNSRIEGQKQLESSNFKAAQDKRDQEIAQAASVASAEKSRVEAEAKAKADIAASTNLAEKNRIDTEARNKLLVENATTTAAVKKAESDQQAESIRTQGEATAASLKAQASAVTPELVELERARRWNGQGPTTVLGAEPQIVNQVPLPR